MSWRWEVKFVVGSFDSGEPHIGSCERSDTSPKNSFSDYSNNNRKAYEKTSNSSNPGTNRSSVYSTSRTTNTPSDSTTNKSTHTQSYYSTNNTAYSK